MLRFLFALCFNLNGPICLVTPQEEIQQLTVRLTNDMASSIAHHHPVPARPTPFEEYFTALDSWYSRLHATLVTQLFAMTRIDDDQKCGRPQSHDNNNINTVDAAKKLADEFIAPTVEIPLDVERVDALRHAHSCYVGASSSISSQEDDDDETAGNIEGNRRINDNKNEAAAAADGDDVVLKELITGIDGAIRQVADGRHECAEETTTTTLPTPAFVKLSTRSPKDVIYDEGNKRVLEACRSEAFVAAARSRFQQLAELEEPYCSSSSEGSIRATFAWSAVVETWLEACAAAFSVSSGEEAVHDMLLQSTRVSFDLNAFADLIKKNGAGRHTQRLPGGGKEDSGAANTEREKKSPQVEQQPLRLSIAVRRWMPLPVSCEFRVFVVNGVITGISQYYHRCYFPELWGQEARIYTLLQRAVAEIIHPVMQAIHCDRVREQPRSQSEVVRYIADFGVVAATSLALAAAVELGEHRQQNTTTTTTENTSAIPFVSSDGMMMQAVLLEVNPFAATTSPCLFDWEDPEDVQQLVVPRCDDGSDISEQSFRRKVRLLRPSSASTIAKENNSGAQCDAIYRLVPPVYRAALEPIVTTILQL